MPGPTKAFAAWLITLAFTIAGTTATAVADNDATYSTPVDPDSPLARHAIEVALPEFEQHGPRLGNYEAIVSREGDFSIVVVFRDPNTPSGQRGSSEAYPCFEVQLDPDITHVIGSYYSR